MSPRRRQRRAVAVFINPAMRGVYANRRNGADAGNLKLQDAMARAVAPDLTRSNCSAGRGTAAGAVRTWYEMIREQARWRTGTAH